MTTAEPGSVPASEEPRPDTAEEPAIEVYWRPGCGFCSRLFRKLDELAVPYRRVDIWEDPAAAERVRDVARGYETVPTVFVGSVALVNPSVHEVLAAAAEHVPAAVPAGYEPPPPGRLARWLGAGRS
jgi:glutaredoxin-like protein